MAVVGCLGLYVDSQVMQQDQANPRMPVGVRMVDRVDPEKK
jgi:hypothetical protein